jgi:Peptidase M50B-like
MVMTFTHEMGHILAGWCCGGTLTTVDLLPWHLPYSIFNPDPKPLVTLWCGPILGVVVPLGLAFAIRREWMWFIANFCVLANGSYLATAWISGDRYLDTPKLLEHGAHPITIVLYCALTIGFGYIGFRRSCIRALSSPQKEWVDAISGGRPDRQPSEEEQSDARQRRTPAD